MTLPRQTIDPAVVILWWCPHCGKVEANTGQSARYCGATRRCTTEKRDGRVGLTAMERWRYLPAGREESA